MEIIMDWPVSINGKLKLPFAASVLVQPAAG
jgi:hypothetical protein